jgi:thiopeptide-type bacteriocin biosynthesis protein
VALLHRLASQPRQTALTRFRAAFVARYEEREVPLVEALDPEIGIGFAPPGGPGGEPAPLLAGLALPAAQDATVRWDSREVFLLGKLTEALAQGADEIVLEPPDLEALVSPEPLPLPDAFMMFVTIVAPSAEALRRGDFRVRLDGGSGPSGARLLGRFCHADAALREHVERYLRAEEAHVPDAIFAEVVHLPEGRIGNVLQRPVLRGYEIPYLGRSGAAPEQQIPITDLLVSVQDSQVVLRSAHLGRRVLPRLTSAHNFNTRSLEIYRFLGALQEQDLVGTLWWRWGPLESAPFLPRLVTGRLILARAQWRVSGDELHALAAARSAERYRTVQAWRARRRLPRWVLLVDYDNELPIDLDNVLSIESFVELAKDRPEATLAEMLPGSDALCATGPEGRFVHELIVPFIRRVGSQPLGERSSAAVAATRAANLPAAHPVRRRTFPPDSEWLYVKLYTGVATADHVLREVIAPVVHLMLKTAAVDHWFFIRYADPDWHLRVRFHGQRERLRAEVLPALQAQVAPLLDDGRVWRVQLDTYEREIERYGGAEGTALAERLFRADSEAVLAIVDQLDGDAGADARWRLTLRGIDQLLGDLGCDLAARQAIIHRVRDGFRREFQGNGLLTRQLGEKFRQERKHLEMLLDPACDAESALQPGLACLHQRSAQLAPVVEALRAVEQAGRLALPLAVLAPSYIHMHANRLLRSAQRAQELVLYDFLDRLYESRLARQRGVRTGRVSAGT